MSEEAPPQEAMSGARAGDIVGAIVIPVFGLIWGLLEMNKRPRAAWQILGASVVSFVLWALILKGTL